VGLRGILCVDNVWNFCVLHRAFLGVVFEGTGMGTGYPESTCWLCSVGDKSEILREERSVCVCVFE
jgi:hypothetical protein